MYSSNNDYGSSVNKKFNKIATLDFTSQRKTMSTVCDNLKTKERTTYLKGAPDRILDNCSSFMDLNGTVQNLGAAQKTKLAQQISDLSLEGLRILAVASIQDGGKLSGLTESNK